MPEPHQRWVWGGAPRAARRGFTLIEILISVVILASASVLVMQALARGAYTLAVATNRIRAYAFVATKMAELSTSLRQGIAPDRSGHFRVGRDEFRWYVQSSELPDGPKLELITLTVGWRQGRRPYEARVGMVRRVPTEKEQS